MSQVALGSVERFDESAVKADPQASLAYGLTMALVAFVGALVVLSIPFAVLSVSLPPDINRLGLSVETTQALLFGRPLYLLVPSTVIAVWIGLWSYRWCCRAVTRETISAKDALEAVPQSRPAI